MPRGRTLSLLHTAAFKKVSATGRLPQCYGNKKGHVLDRGDTYLQVKVGMEEKKYCLQCARAILELGQTKLGALLRELEELKG